MLAKLWIFTDLIFAVHFPLIRNNIFVCMYVCIYVCMYVCIYTHTGFLSGFWSRGIKMRYNGLLGGAKYFRGSKAYGYLGHL